MFFGIRGGDTATPTKSLFRIKFRDRFGKVLLMVVGSLLDSMFDDCLCCVHHFFEHRCCMDLFIDLGMDFGIIFDVRLTLTLFPLAHATS